MCAVDSYPTQGSPFSHLNSESFLSTDVTTQADELFRIWHYLVQPYLLGPYQLLLLGFTVH